MINIESSFTKVFTTIKLLRESKENGYSIQMTNEFKIKIVSLPYFY